jgi:hypothetical protein
MRCIKAVSCLLREPGSFDLSLETSVPCNANPRAGDLVFLRSLSNNGCVKHLENQDGLMIRIYEGDIFVGALAPRRSGYHIFARMPEGPVSKGDVVALTYRNGISAIPLCIPTYLGESAMPVEVVGFVSGKNGHIANLSDAAPVDPAKWGTARPRSGNLLFVIGTSSEIGKTTFVSNLNLAIKRQYPEIRTGAIKACGSGSNRDKQAMLDANFDCAVDFVDCGLAATYDIASSDYARVLRAMLNFVQARSDLVVTEIGGDFLEASAPEALQLLSQLDAACVLQVNDAMGAFEGLRRLQALGLKPIAISSIRQNLMSLSARLEAEGYRNIITLDNRDEAAIDDVAATYIRSAFANHRIYPCERNSMAHRPQPEAVV